MSDWTAAWNASPTDTDLVGNGDEAIADTRDTIGDRLTKEHFLNMSEVSPQPQQGRHRPGSAVSFAQASAPTLKPDGSAVLDAIDHGRLWIDTDTGVMYFWKWDSGTSSGAWTECAPAHGMVLLTSGTSWTATHTGPVKVTCVGGGGGGGGPNTNTSAAETFAGGGQAGGVAQRIYNVIAGTDYACAIGSGGAGGAASPSGAYGGRGGDTTFTDGVNALFAGGGTEGSRGATVVYGNPYYGQASGGTLNIPGGAGALSASITALSNRIQAMYGGSNMYGCGGGAQDVGQGYGGGGGGGSYRPGETALPGGAGAAGCIIIEW